jgi:hypothetical protein
MFFGGAALAYRFEEHIALKMETFERWSWVKLITHAVYFLNLPILPIDY